METNQHVAQKNASILSNLVERSGGKAVAAAHTHCWYCNKPLNGYRRFCSKDCEDAIYEDNEAARTRRFIFGCDC